MLNLRLLWNLISCTFTHPKNMPKVYIRQTDGSRMILEPLDILAFHAHSFVAKGIQICTDSKYNHVGLYCGNGRIFHAIYPNIIIQRIEEAWEDSDKFIDVYRYQNKDGRTLTFQQRDKLIETANEYVKQGNRYAVEALFILAIVTELRKDTGYLGRKLIEKSFQKINDAFEKGKEPVICSELIYRIFEESGVPVKIIPEGLYKEFRESKDTMIQEIRASKESINKVSADFITPKDLVMSPDIKFKGQLVKEF